MQNCPLWGGELFQLICLFLQKKFYCILKSIMFLGLHIKKKYCCNFVILLYRRISTKIKSINVNNFLLYNNLQYNYI